VNIITRRRLKAWCRQHHQARSALLAWYGVSTKARWDNLSQLRHDFPNADGVVVASGKVVTVFNIHGDTYRMIAAVHYDHKRVYLLRFLTHADYDKAKWKVQL
jgi:mRNA interferase HigB